MVFFALAYTAPPGNTVSKAILRAFIQCTVDPVAAIMAPFVSKAKAEEWEVREIASENDPIISHPDELTKILKDLSAI